MFRIAKSTTIGVCQDFAQALCQIKDQFIKFPNTPGYHPRENSRFQGKTFHNVVGAIDGTHIPIRTPKINHEDYFNCKHYYSFVAQGIVDASGSYLSLSTGFLGSMHDACVFETKQFASTGRREENLDYTLHGFKWIKSLASYFRCFCLPSQGMAHASLSGQWSSDSSSTIDRNSSISLRNTFNINEHSHLRMTRTCNTNNVVRTTRTRPQSGKSYSVSRSNYSVLLYLPPSL